MAWFRKKADPISDRARALSAEIAQLEAEIRRLEPRLQPPAESPRLRSTALPQGSAPAASSPPPAPPPGAREPIFEEVDQDRLKSRDEGGISPEHFNDLGVRKYDLPALLKRVRNHFRAPTTTNPKLVNYLAAGGIQGLRPLRYEKRVARNRFLLLVIVIVAVLLGITLALIGRH